MPKITFRNFDQGGLAPSRFYGSNRQFARAVGFNLHNSPGLLQVNQRMSLASGAVVDEFCQNKVNASTGIRYWFSAESGAIWQDNGGTFTLVYTTSPAAGGAVCLGAREFQGFIYWATQSRLHRIPVGSANGAAAWTANAVPNWATFTATDLSYHPMTEVNLVLYIGDGRYVAQVDAGVFSATALDLAAGFRVSALGKSGVDLAIGTIISTTTNKCSIFYWNGWSVSFSYEDELQENGVNAFIEGANLTLVSAGRAGKLYILGGVNQKSRYLKYGSVPGTFSPTATGIVYPEAWGVYQGNIIFGFSNVAGNPADQGIYSFVLAGDVAVRNLEFPISRVDGSGYNIISNVEIGAVMVVGSNVYISWRDSTGAAVSGIDQLDYSNKVAQPFMELPVLTPDRSSEFNFRKILAHYASLPSGTSIVIRKRENLAGSFAAASTVIDDTQRNVVYNEEDAEAKNLEARIECVSSGNNAPEIEAVEIEY